jgi:hypothetical protein
LCKLCHLVKHFGLTRRKGLENEARRHLKHVNNWTDAQAQVHIDENFALWRERNKYAWTQDLGDFAR